MSVQGIGTATVEHSITVVGGQLQYEDGYRLPVYVGKSYIEVGCHRISREAWKLLKQIVEESK